jgi:DNA-binding MarR family transcriptional regulator
MSDGPILDDQIQQGHTPSEQGYDFSEQIGHLLRRAYQHHTAIFQQLSDRKKLTAIQFVVLCTVMDHGACSIIDIVSATAIDPATARGVLNRLRDRALLHITRDPGDQRKAQVTITETGKEIVREMIPQAKQISEATMERLSQPEALVLTMLLKKMVQAD